jgi:hypothetical protein
MISIMHVLRKMCIAMFVWFSFLIKAFPDPFISPIRIFLTGCIILNYNLDVGLR